MGSTWQRTRSPAFPLHCDLVISCQVSASQPTGDESMVGPLGRHILANRLVSHKNLKRYGQVSFHDRFSHDRTYLAIVENLANSSMILVDERASQTTASGPGRHQRCAHRRKVLRDCSTDNSPQHVFLFLFLGLLSVVA